jgi:hypothetical protein
LARKIDRRDRISGAFGGRRRQPDRAVVGRPQAAREVGRKRIPPREAELSADAAM